MSRTLFYTSDEVDTGCVCKAPENITSAPTTLQMYRFGHKLQDR
jgi:hypothetical protein